MPGRLTVEPSWSRSTTMTFRSAWLSVALDRWIQMGEGRRKAVGVRELGDAGCPGECAQRADLPLNNMFN